MFNFDYHYHFRRILCIYLLIFECWFAQIQDPEVTGFHPAVGPVSGGSRLTVIGRHLDVGSHVTVILTNGGNATVHCQVSGKRLLDLVVCTTGASRTPAVMNFLAVSVDSARVNFDGQFRFVPDPVIESVMPFKSVVRYLTSLCICRYSQQWHRTAGSCKCAKKVYSD